MASYVTAIFSLSLMVLALLIFLGAVLHKIFDFGEFQGFVADYQLLPEILVKPTSLLLVIVEAGVVLLMLWSPTRIFALTLAAGLLALYALAIAVNLRRGRTQIECGCGGAPQWLSAALVWRNLLLIALVLLPLWRMPAGLQVSEITAALLAGVFLWVMVRFFEQSNANWQQVALAGWGRAGRRRGHL
jgi:hypothetical protein